ncbi:MAG: hypothetical protein ACUZ8H_10580 [Candidatus Anammoxibacter sp.]
MIKGKLYTAKEISEELDIPYHKLDYLFKSRRLKSENFITLGNGQRLFYAEDIPRVKQALFETQNK